MIKDQPAFPVSPQAQHIFEMGMTLRDYFAAQAMAAYVSRPTDGETKIAGIAEWSYLMADEMIKARTK